MLYNVYHAYDVDTGSGDAAPVKDYIATVEATEEEIEAFKKEWNRPRIYDRPYASLYEHIIVVRKVELTDLKDVVPYPPEEKDLPDCPKTKYNNEDNDFEEDEGDNYA